MPTHQGATSRVKVHSIRALAGCCFIPGWSIVLWFLVLLTWRFSIITWSTNSLTRVLFNCRSNLPHMELGMILATGSATWIVLHACYGEPKYREGSRPFPLEFRSSWLLPLFSTICHRNLRRELLVNGGSTSVFDVKNLVALVHSLLDFLGSPSA